MTENILNYLIAAKELIKIRHTERFNHWLEAHPQFQENLNTFEAISHDPFVKQPSLKEAWTILNELLISDKNEEAFQAVLNTPLVLEQIPAMLPVLENLKIVSDGWLNSQHHHVLLALIDMRYLIVEMNGDECKQWINQQPAIDEKLQKFFNDYLQMLCTKQSDLKEIIFQVFSELGKTYDNTNLYNVLHMHFHTHAILYQIFNVNEFYPLLDIAKEWKAYKDITYTSPLLLKQPHPEAKNANININNVTAYQDELAWQSHFINSYKNKYVGNSTKVTVRVSWDKNEVSPDKGKVTAITLLNTNNQVLAIYRKDNPRLGQALSELPLHDAENYHQEIRNTSALCIRDYQEMCALGNDKLYDFISSYNHLDLLFRKKDQKENKMLRFKKNEAKSVCLCR